jgi:hypothetical protein
MTETEGRGGGSRRRVEAEGRGGGSRRRALAVGRCRGSTTGLSSDLSIRDLFQSSSFKLYIEDVVIDANTDQLRERKEKLHFSGFPADIARTKVILTIHQSIEPPFREQRMKLIVS